MYLVFIFGFFFGGGNRLQPQYTVYCVSSGISRFDNVGLLVLLIHGSVMLIISDGIFQLCQVNVLLGLNTSCYDISNLTVVFLFTFLVSTYYSFSISGGYISKDFQPCLWQIFKQHFANNTLTLLYEKKSCYFHYVVHIQLKLVPINPQFHFDSLYYFQDTEKVGFHLK